MGYYHAQLRALGISHLINGTLEPLPCVGMQLDSFFFGSGRSGFIYHGNGTVAQQGGSWEPPRLFAILWATKPT